MATTTIAPLDGLNSPVFLPPRSQDEVDSRLEAARVVAAKNGLEVRQTGLRSGSIPLGNGQAVQAPLYQLCRDGMPFDMPCPLWQLEMALWNEDVERLKRAAYERNRAAEAGRRQREREENPTVDDLQKEIARLRDEVGALRTKADYQSGLVTDDGQMTEKGKREWLRVTGRQN